MKANPGTVIQTFPFGTIVVTDDNKIYKIIDRKYNHETSTYDYHAISNNPFIDPLEKYMIMNHAYVETHKWTYKEQE